MEFSLSLGKLYRSARRAVTGWSRAISNHGNPRHIHLALSLAAGVDNEDPENTLSLMKTNASTVYAQPLDPEIYHPEWRKYRADIKQLYHMYRNELLEIISLYRFQDEVDLFCRSDDMDASAGAAKKGSIEDSAAIEVQNLVQRIQRDFFQEFDQRRREGRCECKTWIGEDSRRKVHYCHRCSEEKLAKAACAYIYCYQESNKLPLKSNRRILSFPWYFADYLTVLKYRNRKPDYIDQTNTLVGRVLSTYLANVTPKFNVFLPEHVTDEVRVKFLFREIEEQRSNLLRREKKPDQTIGGVTVLQACFVEALHDWLIKQRIFGDSCVETLDKPLVPETLWHELVVHFLSGRYHPNVTLILFSKQQEDLVERNRRAIEMYRHQWTPGEHRAMLDMFRKLHLLLVEHVNQTKSTLWTYLHEYILLALQCIAIEKKLEEKWICPGSF